MRFVPETAIGIPDGVRTIFRTSVAYVPGSLMVFLNGQLKERDHEDGFEEMGGRKFRMKEAPRSFEVVQVAYIAV